MVKECCGTCRHNKRDWDERKDTVFYCDNEESDDYGCYTTYTDRCNDWEGKEVSE